MKKLYNYKKIYNDLKILLDERILNSDLHIDLINMINNFVNPPKTIDLLEILDSIQKLVLLKDVKKTINDQETNFYLDKYPNFSTFIRRSSDETQSLSIDIGPDLIKVIYFYPKRYQLIKIDFSQNNIINIREEKTLVSNTLVTNFIKELTYQNNFLKMRRSENKHITLINSELITTLTTEDYRETKGISKRTVDKGNNFKSTESYISFSLDSPFVYNNIKDGPIIKRVTQEKITKEQYQKLLKDISI